MTDRTRTRYAVFGLSIQQYWADGDGEWDVWRPLNDPKVWLFDSVTEAATALAESGKNIGPVAIHRIFVHVNPYREIGGIVE